MAVQGVLANRLRSLLTLLGITIGVASVIILVAVGRGSAVAVQTQIEGLGTNMMTVQAGGRFFGRAASSSSTFTFLTMKDVKALSGQDRRAGHQVGLARRHRPARSPPRTASRPRRPGR